MKKRRDYIEPGSAAHAIQLGLREAGAEDDLQYDTWTFTDFERYGPNATDRYLKAVLAQAVRTLTGQHPKLQSKDPLAPNYAQPMFVPQGGGASGIV